MTVDNPIPGLTFDDVLRLTADARAMGQHLRVSALVHGQIAEAVLTLPPTLALDDFDVDQLPRPIEVITADEASRNVGYVNGAWRFLTPAPTAEGTALAKKLVGLSSFAEQVNADQAAELAKKLAGTELARQLTALWAPPRRVAPADDADLLDEDDDYCTGSGGCGCPRCHHDEHVRTARCSLKDCSEPTLFRLRVWRADSSGRRVQASEIGRTENPDEWLPFGDAQVFMSTERYACSKPHAYELWQQLRARYSNPPDGDESKRWRVEIENWQYKPDWFDLPHPDLFWLREFVGSMKYDVRRIIDAVNPHAAHRTRDVSFELADARRSAARIVALLAGLDTRAIPQVRYTDAIPADVSTVLTAPVGQQPNYINRRWPETPASGWYCSALEVAYESDAELLAAYPDGLYERPRTELVLPTRDDVALSLDWS